MKIPLYKICWWILIDGKDELVDNLRSWKTAFLRLRLINYIRNVWDEGGE